MNSFRAAVIQLSCGSDEEANLDVAERLIDEARAAGAELIATPENTNLLGPAPEKARRAEGLDGPVCRRFAGIARRSGAHLLLGSFNERGPDPQRCYNTSVLFGPDGSTIASYRKIHLFDVNLSPKVAFVESQHVAPGESCVVADTVLARLGLSICYDLRFPELYRSLAGQGAEVLAVPSAFTRITGAAHWEILLRARAIENQCFVVAPAQWGEHDDDGIRESYGHAMIVDPWGSVLATAGDGVGIAVADLDSSRLEEVRAGLPARRHRRL